MSQPAKLHEYLARLDAYVGRIPARTGPRRPHEGRGLRERCEKARSGPERPDRIQLQPGRQAPQGRESEVQTEAGDREASEGEGARRSFRSPAKEVASAAAAAAAAAATSQIVLTFNRGRTGWVVSASGSVARVAALPFRLVCGCCWRRREALDGGSDRHVGLGRCRRGRARGGGGDTRNSRVSSKAIAMLYPKSSPLLNQSRPIVIGDVAAVEEEPQNRVEVIPTPGVAGHDSFGFFEKIWWE